MFPVMAYLLSRILTAEVQPRPVDAPAVSVVFLEKGFKPWH
jgi:hypothetical protein